jgi:hypothetical protein
MSPLQKWPSTRHDSQTLKITADLYWNGPLGPVRLGAHRLFCRAEDVSAGYQYHHCGGLGVRREPGSAGRWVRCGGALALDVGQALGEPTISDPDDIHAAHMPVCPVVAPAHDGAS